MTALLVYKIARLDAAMEANLQRTSELAAARRKAIAELIGQVGAAETGRLLGISKTAVYKYRGEVKR